MNFLPPKPREGDYFDKLFAKIGPKTVEILDISDTLSIKIAVKAFLMKLEERDSLDVG